MIDLHCHILPGMDDGARLLAESLDMARTALLNNIEVIVATPHTLNGFFINKPDEVFALTSTVQLALDSEEIPLKLYSGMEVQICPELFDALDEGAIATINNARYLLLEFPPFSMPEGSVEFISKLKNMGLIPVIAHPERHLILQKNLAQLQKLVNHGALCQLTALSITGHLGPFVRKSAELMIENGLAHVIATDAHADDIRISALVSAVAAAAEILGDYSKAQNMVTSIPEAIIAGEDVIL